MRLGRSRRGRGLFSCYTLSFSLRKSGVSFHCSSALPQRKLHIRGVFRVQLSPTLPNTLHGLKRFKSTRQSIRPRPTDSHSRQLTGFEIRGDLGLGHSGLSINIT